MAKTPRISIIVPVYNAGKYLERCVNSIVSSLGDITGEILLILNNCNVSSDNSLEMIDKLHKKYKTITSVLACNSPGASASRNLGVEKARGEYIWFVDADDYISKTAISQLVRKADDKKADLVMFGAKRLYLDGSSNYLSPVDEKSDNYKSRFVRYGMGPWQVLIRRKWWVVNGFKFDVGIIHEDMALMSALILSTDRYANVNEPFYYYCENPDSVLHKKEFSPHIFDIFPALENLYQRFADKNALETYHAELEWFFIWNLLIDSAKDFGKFKAGKPGFMHARAMLKRYFPKWRKNLFLRQKPLKLQIKVRLNYFK